MCHRNLSKYHSISPRLYRVIIILYHTTMIKCNIEQHYRVWRIAIILSNTQPDKLTTSITIYKQSNVPLLVIIFVHIFVNEYGKLFDNPLTISIQFKALFRVDINHTYNTSSNELLKSTMVYNNTCVTGT
jgi:hypothetical protein